MGQFSWLDCKTQEQVLDGVERDVYVLIPKEFGGFGLKESCYNGYGCFGGYDIYSLVACWNRDFLSENPNFIPPKSGKKVLDYVWYPYYADLALSEEEVVEETNDNKGDKWFCPEWRSIGIDIACYDEDNAALPYPIKITHDPDAVYENCDASLSDPNQGWKY